MTGLPRDVTRWLQSLELTVHPMNVRRDFSSGYHVAEMFCRYYPRDFEMHAYSKGTSFSAKQDNWNRIRRTVQKLHLHLPEKLVYGTMHCKPGAAELLVQQVYTILTKHRPRTAHNPELDFSDQKYQQLLPAVARSTATTAVKSNLRKTEILALPDTLTNGRRAEAIICKHLQDKTAARTATDRGRSNVVKSRLKQMTGKNLSRDEKRLSELCLQSPLNGAVVSYKTIKVNQPARRLPQSC
ncbi:spermatogenesis-associated protein 4 isoform X2 [Syngnathoides biaculeatus]|uniref:spermatogenesis-associated protein 4 isoform X2 n=1 Tax=Syngnathoides biaculeatus TaxID=300417 RepID=UPI002ADDDD8D|nr:spermatogenesis-associated protein 4 isoform X2 [Syngnathoides biaculeatus]